MDRFVTAAFGLVGFVGGLHTVAEGWLSTVGACPASVFTGAGSLLCISQPSEAVGPWLLNSLPEEACHVTPLQSFQTGLTVIIFRQPFPDV